ncbi:MAG: branched-chain amino acid ABC transporter permease [Dehalococcoidia bacterium]|nr:branched-chain amino acid ABC transporter permease [Dehalococcoidia bacterium]
MSLPCGIRNYSYNTDTAIIRTKTQWVLLSIFLVLVLSMPSYMRSSDLYVANLIGITIIAVIGLNILVGYCGQLSIGHAGFMAVGAYTTAILTTSFGVPFFAALICSGLSAGIIGLLFGMPSMRVKGFYLAITTIAAQFIIVWIINHWTDVTRGSMGMSVSSATIGSFSFDSEAQQFYLIMAITAICVFFATNLARSRIGRAFIAVRDNDLAAEVMGINVFAYKLLAFFLGCFFAGIAGSLFAQLRGTITAEDFTFSQSILYIGMLIIGGLGTSIGPILGVGIIGSLFYWFLPSVAVPFLEASSWLPTGFSSGLGHMIFGAVMIAFLVLEPKGMAHLWSLFKASYRLWPFSY